MYESDYIVAFDTYLERLRDIKAPLKLYKEALESAIDDLKRELEAMNEGEGDDQRDGK